LILKQLPSTSTIELLDNQPLVKASGPFQSGSSVAVRIPFWHQLDDCYQQHPLVLAPDWCEKPTIKRDLHFRK